MNSSRDHSSPATGVGMLVKLAGGIVCMSVVRMPLSEYSESPSELVARNWTSYSVSACSEVQVCVRLVWSRRLPQMLLDVRLMRKS